MTIYLAKFVKNKLALMGINTIVFSVNMYIIAFMLKFFADMGDEVFLVLWGILALEEFVTMTLGIVLIYLLNKRLNFSKLV